MDLNQLAKLRDLCKDEAAFERLKQALVTPLDASSITQALTQTQQQLDRQQALARVISRIRENLDLATIFQISTQEICQLLSADRVAVYRFNPDWSGDFVAEYVMPEWSPLVGPEIQKVWEDTYLQEHQGGRYRQQETFAVANIYQSGLTDCHIDLLEQFQAKAFAIVPIFAGRKLWGLLAAYQNSGLRQWESNEVDLLVQLGEQFGVAIQQSELLARLQETQRLAHIGNWDYDLTTQTLTWSDETYRLFGLEPIQAEPTYDEFLNRIHPDDRPTLLAAIQQAIAECTLYDLDLRIIHTDGSIRYLAMKGQPFCNVAGRVTRLFGAMLDITERKYAEIAVQTLNQELSKSVVELTAVNRELEAFSYSVSHDLRAPLRSINGYSQALLEDCWDRLDHTGQRYLQRIRSATERMGELIDDVLILSRITRSDMTFQPVNLSELAQESLVDLRAANPDRQVDCQIQDQVIAWGDRTLLKVLLLNLLDNAWKFTSKQSHAHIEFATTEDNDGKLLYFVRDDGTGFDMAYADKLFGAFQRLHSAQDFLGTGIGLATAQRIVHRHGGKIWGESAIGQGATFFFTLETK
ncbi:MAG TPA: GAF domain-containing protein [Microcoleaceae cyanobacterium]|jgi:PAS domain S-box-containing protein